MNNLQIQPYRSEHWPKLIRLLKRWPFKPMAYSRNCDDSKLFHLAGERVRATLNDVDGAKATLILSADQVVGFASMRPLTWDTEQLGVPAARLEHLIADGSYLEQFEIKNHLLTNLLLRAFEEGVIHISSRVDASDFSSLHALERAGFVTVDSILHFAVDFEKRDVPKPQHGFTIRLAEPADAERVSSLAKTSFVYDRFHSDPFVSRKTADDLHGSWLRNSCAENSRDNVLLAESKNELLGFVSCTVQADTARWLGRSIGTIILVACAEQARRRGVGRTLMLAAGQWLRQQGCEIVESGTQVRNVPSARMFRQCGFDYVGASISLRHSFAPAQPAVIPLDPSVVGIHLHDRPSHLSSEH
jgi:ribosomal protein S18 acetylase RimI-like enzyme